MLRPTRQFLSSTVIARQKFFSSVPENNGISTIAKKTIEVPTWGLFTIGATGIGFFGKILHDDNLATRQEIGSVRQEIGSVRQEIESVRHEIHENVKELRQDYKELKNEVHALERKMDQGFQELKEVILANKESPSK